MLPLIEGILVITGLSLGVLWLCHRLKVPSIVGLLLTGVLAGPHGLGLVSGVHEVEVLAEVGIILLLFAIGIEFSFRSFIRAGRDLLGGGSLQVVLTAAIGFGAAGLAGWRPNPALVAGLLLALSSTAVVIRLLQDRGELDAPHGRLAVNILIFQDLAAVLMMAALPLLAGVAGPGGPPLAEFLEGAALLAAALVGGWWLFPRFLHLLGLTRNREIFLLGVLFVGFGLSWLAARAGLSPALGAFLAGLLISESDYAHYAIGHLIPMRDIFASLFFISIGMLFQVELFLREPLTLLALALGIVAVKGLIVWGVVLLLRYPFRIALLTGLALAQVGEFSFVLGRLALDHRLLEPRVFDLFVMSAFLTLLATPFLMAAGPAFLRWRARRRSVEESLPPATPGDEADRPVVIAGYGAAGETLARTAREAGLPYVVIDLNPLNVQRARERGEPVVAGDASLPSVLAHAGLPRAVLLVVALPDPEGTRRTVQTARELAPELPILVRARYLRDVEGLRRLGADEVLVEEREIAVALAERILERCGASHDAVEAWINRLRAEAAGPK